MKFRHHFQFIEQSASRLQFKSDGVQIRLDFFDHILRVAMVKDGSYLLPTYTVCPDFESKSTGSCGDPIIPREGRDKLSTEGFILSTPAITRDNDTVHIAFSDLNVSINLFNFRMKVSNEKGLLYEDRDYIAYNFDHELGDGSMHFITREADEEIFGLGDKTGHVNKNKLNFKMEASDAMGFDARSSDPLYKQLPFYICRNSNGAYGLYYDTYSNGELNFGREINNYYDPFKSARFDEENLVFYLFWGSVPEISKRFSQMCGPMLFPPKWTLQYNGSTMAYTDAPDADAQLRRFIEQCEAYDLHPGGFYLSSGYTQIGEKRCVFHWNLDKIPDPEGLAQFFKDHGVEFLPNVKPAFLTEHPLYDAIAEKGWFLHYEDGSPALFPFWSGFGSYLDFTNPDAYDFWTDCVKKQLVDKGYKNIWNDNNEYDIQAKDIYAYGFGHPLKAHEIRPLFSFLMTMASLEAQDHSIRTASVSRCGIAGLQRIATTWTGDNRTSFEDFRFNHYMAMTMSLSGFYNFGQDIGGFAGPCPSEELFLRWIQYGLFTPRFVLHSWNPDGSSTMPWLYPEKKEVVQRLFHLRDQLVPYLYQEMYRSVTKHEPIIYPVFLKNEAYDTEADCFFFGDQILACPIFDEGRKEVTVLLPDHVEGWYAGAASLSGQAPDATLYTGEITRTCKMDDEPVWFVKAGSVVPYYYEDANNNASDMTSSTNKGNLAFTKDEARFEATDFYIYAIKEGHFSYDYLVDDGVSNLEEDNHYILHFDVTCDKNFVNVEIKGSQKKSPLVLMDAWNRKLSVSY